MRVVERGKPDAYGLEAHPPKTLHKLSISGYHS